MKNKKRGFSLINLIKRNRKAQIFGMPFSVIFSLFLIAIFILVAFFAIKYFLNIKRCNEIGLFIDDLQTEINKAWNSESSSKTFERSLPAGIEYICIANLSKKADVEGKEKEIYNELRKSEKYSDNLFFYPKKKACIPSTKIQHIKIISNPYCIPIKQGKVKIKIEKGFYDALVKIIKL